VGHIKVLGGPYVARGPDVAQACFKESKKKSKSHVQQIKAINHAWKNIPFVSLICKCSNESRTFMPNKIDLITVIQKIVCKSQLQIFILTKLEKEEKDCPKNYL
jgi:hypothetical protein